MVCSLVNTCYENVVLGIRCAQDPVLRSGGCSGGHEGPPEISHHACQVTRRTHRKLVQTGSREDERRWDRKSNGLGAGKGGGSMRGLIGVAEKVEEGARFVFGAKEST